MNKWAIKKASADDVVRYGSGAFHTRIGTPVTYRTKEEAMRNLIYEDEIVVKAADFPAYVSGYEW